MKKDINLFELIGASQRMKSVTSNNYYEIEPNQIVEQLTYHRFRNNSFLITGTNKVGYIDQSILDRYFRKFTLHKKETEC